ncbi:subtype B tannase [Metabacillus litoralis]|uniref:subtype B tannase n=1 Tax=Metabacillus litoralis TaxID=152268 RepID=UPI00203EE83F|nr:subtype B tannase [Metabacillus litoralis]MCM3411861.1 alpha/beta hydrolase [Metabacillus litoralis]
MPVSKESKKKLSTVLISSLLISGLTTVSLTPSNVSAVSQQQVKVSHQVENIIQKRGKALKEYSLKFNQNNYKIESITVGDKTVTYRAYENIVYVSNPVDTNLQIMNIYVPEEYFENATIEGYTAKTAPIFFPNQIGGYREASPATPERESVALALSRGYVVASPGARGHNSESENGKYTGKAPAAIVDLKAAVRYLRYNDKLIPGSAEKIIANGTSAGGALTSLLGATGNNKDYDSYLKEIGAANARDDIFAVSSYCPITNLDHADMAYEWLFNGVNTYNWRGSGTLTDEQIQISNELKMLFPEYVNSLELVNYESRNTNGKGLKKAPGQFKKGTVLTLDANGEGTFKELVKFYVIESAQSALDAGTDLSDFDWLTIKDENVTDIDLEQFVVYATRMKTPPAFDALDASSWENSLFGTDTIAGQHFTQYSFENSAVNGSLADAQRVKMMNPMNYIGTKGANTAQYWRIRHGTIDRDTSLAIPVILATKLQNEGKNVDFAMPWNIGHSGDYDLEELFAWVDSISKSSGNHK